MNFDAKLTLAPDQKLVVGEKVWGFIYEDSKERFEDDQLVLTSTIQNVIQNDQMLQTFIITKNTVYLIIEGRWNNDYCI